MPISIPLGAPVWADANTPDLAGDLVFYTKLFGWTTFDSGEEFGHYTEFCLGTSASNARVVAGIAPNQSDQRGKPSAWGLSFHVEDCVRTATAAEKLGATAVTHPMRVGDDLVWANMKDPDGAAFGLYEPLRADMGFTAFGEPGAAAWFEYAYDGVPAVAMQFYAELLDWEVTVPAWEDPRNRRPYVSLHAREAGLEFGGAAVIGEDDPDASPRWTVCFEVAAVDRLAARAPALGGEVVGPAHDLPGLRVATLSSPTGARFGILERTG
ncbi:VOC family protein [Glycomyces buryatensis]|uniref:VOC family protein n=1 Tax=Glycomyces buryatensis TaxID=2570927 RepID=A0A4S8QHV1_9ACTN|nr:VOC family protein [Glycomyces buryatensis]THV42822.1 VOC family protein [Glycomyces buryatensis]